MADEKYNVEEMVAAIKASGGMITKASTVLGCAPNTIYNYAKKYPEVAAALDFHRELILDLAEQGVYEGVKQKKEWAIKLVLTTLGGKRGYGQSITFDTGNLPLIQVEYTSTPQLTDEAED